MLILASQSHAPGRCDGEETLRSDTRRRECGDDDVIHRTHISGRGINGCVLANMNGID